MSHAWQAVPRRSGLFGGFMLSRPAILLAAAAGLGITALAAPDLGAQQPGRGRDQAHQEPPRQHEQPRQSQPEARPRQDPPPRAEPSRPPQAERTPPPRSTGEPELRRRKP